MIDFESQLETALNLSAAIQLTEPEWPWWRDWLLEQSPEGVHATLSDEALMIDIITVTTDDGRNCAFVRSGT